MSKRINELIKNKEILESTFIKVNFSDWEASKQEIFCGFFQMSITHLLRGKVEL